MEQPFVIKYSSHHQTKLLTPNPLFTNNPLFPPLGAPYLEQSSMLSISTASSTIHAPDCPLSLHFPSHQWFFSGSVQWRRFIPHLSWLLIRTWDCYMLPVSWSSHPPWLLDVTWRYLFSIFSSSVRSWNVGSLGYCLCALLTSHILSECLFPRLLKSKHSFISIFFSSATHTTNHLPAIFTWISPKHLKPNMAEIELSLICFLSLVLNLIEKPTVHLIAQVWNQDIILDSSSPSTPYLFSNFISQIFPEYFHSFPSPLPWHQSTYHYLSRGLLQQLLIQSLFLQHGVLLIQTLPSHQKYLSKFLSSDVTLQLENHHPFPLGLLDNVQTPSYGSESHFWYDLCLLLWPCLL